MAIKPPAKESHAYKSQAPAEKRVDYKIQRLIWGSSHARDFQAYLSNRPLAAKRLSEILKNSSYQVFGFVDSKKQPLAYYAVMLINNDNSMLVHHADALSAGGLNSETTMVLLDHTGCEHAMVVGQDEKGVELYKRIGFILVENNWRTATSPYAHLPVDKHIRDISGLEELSNAEVDTFENIVSQTLRQEGECDPLKRNIFKDLLPSEVVERARTSQYRTLAWYEKKVMVGIVQLQYTEWGEVILSGVGVSDEYKSRRIGRNLIAAACKLASRSHEYILSSTFSNNVVMEHLLGNLLRWERIVGTYGVTLDADAVSWKRTKRAGSTAGHGQPTYTGQ